LVNFIITKCTRCKIYSFSIFDKTVVLRESSQKYLLQQLFFLNIFDKNTIYYNFSGFADLKWALFLFILNLTHSYSHFKIWVEKLKFGINFFNGQNFNICQKWWKSKTKLSQWLWKRKVNYINRNNFLLIQLSISMNEKVYFAIFSQFLYKTNKGHKIILLHAFKHQVQLK